MEIFGTENYISSTAAKTLTHSLFKDHMQAAVTLHDSVDSVHEISFRGGRTHL